MKKVLTTISSVAVSALPVLALAQSTTLTDRTLGGVVSWAINMINVIVPLIIAIAVVWFIWNVFQYAIQGDEDKKKAAKGNIIWGIVAIFVMVSVWGLVNILENTFGVSGISAQPNLGSKLIPR